MKRIIYILILLMVWSCSSYKKIPPPKEEFRGVWIATVANIDWPKNKNDTLKKQQNDFLEILDFYKELNFNAVIVQIRTAGDALYPSKFAPWSRFLTGNEGKAPSKEYDPLKWIIDQTHKRGFEFHAWLNPYRATFNLDTTILGKEHDFFKHKNWMIKYGKKYYYNPGLPEVREHLISIMEEVVENYDIDAIHFDDYFYPYKIKGEFFNDSLTYKNQNLRGLTLDDWRRSNIDSLVKGIHKKIKQKKPTVQFGISPFGIWRNKSDDPKGSDTQALQTTYDDLYADVLLWAQEKWIDYLVPQIYWHIEHSVVSHQKVLNWWNSQQLDHVNLYIGNGVYRVKNNEAKAWNRKEEIPNQLLLARNAANVKGNVFFSAKSLMQKPKWLKRRLKRMFYSYPALVNGKNDSIKTK